MPHNGFPWTRGPTKDFWDGSCPFTSMYVSGTLERERHLSSVTDCPRTLEAVLRDANIVVSGDVD